MLSLYLCTVDVPYQSYGEVDIIKLKEIFAEIVEKKKDAVKKSVARQKNSSAIPRHAQNVLLDRDQK